MPSEYRYFEGAGDIWFCFATAPTFTCPHAEQPPATLLAAAGPLGIDLEGMFTSAHRRYGVGRRRVDGRVTDRCTACGAKMTRRGFRCWRSAPAAAAAGATSALDVALFGEDRTISAVHYLDTKREAREWAREEARISRAAADDAHAGA